MHIYVVIVLIRIIGIIIFVIIVNISCPLSVWIFTSRYMNPINHLKLMTVQYWSHFCHHHKGSVPRKNTIRLVIITIIIRSMCSLSSKPPLLSLPSLMIIWDCANGDHHLQTLVACSFNLKKGPEEVIEQWWGMMNWILDNWLI